MRTILALALVTGCAKSPFPTATITVDGRPVRVEIAHTRALRAQGLMHRDHLPQDEGMLFVYPSAENRSFWMKNTRIPLDIAFVDANGEIVRIAQMEPFSTARTPSLLPVPYALEMNAGWFAMNDVVVGDRITDLPDIDAEP